MHFLSLLEYENICHARNSSWHEVTVWGRQASYIHNTSDIKVSGSPTFNIFILIKIHTINSLPPTITNNHTHTHLPLHTSSIKASAFHSTTNHQPPTTSSTCSPRLSSPPLWQASPLLLPLSRDRPPMSLAWSPLAVETQMFISAPLLPTASDSGSERRLPPTVHPASRASTAQQVRFYSLPLPSTNFHN